MDRRTTLLNESPHDLDSQGIRARLLHFVGERGGRIQGDGFLRTGARTDAAMVRSGCCDQVAVEGGANSFRQRSSGNEAKGDRGAIIADPTREADPSLCLPAAGTPGLTSYPTRLVAEVARGQSYS